MQQRKKEVEMMKQKFKINLEKFLIPIKNKFKINQIEIA